MSITVTRELPPDTLALTVEGQSGVLARWGPDEVDGADVPLALQFGTSIPNGFKDLSSSLLRRIDLDYPDLQLLGDVKVYGPGQETVWEGRMTQFPRDHGSDFSIAPSAVGWAAHLLDDPQFSEVYIDRDFSKWAGPSNARKLALITASFNPIDPTQDLDVATGNPSLSQVAVGAWSATGRPACEAVYRAPSGVTLGSVYYEWTRGANLDNADTNWTWDAWLATDDSTPAGDTTGNLRAAGPGSGTLSASTATRTAAMLRLLFAVAAGAEGTNYVLYWRNLAVYGNHGLTKQGSAPQGFYLSDIIANVVSRAAPLLSTSGIDTNSIVIPHCVFEHTTASDAILQLNNYAQWDWGVYDNREFFFRAPDPDRLTWTVRLSEGIQLSLEGEEADDQYNGVVVTFNDPSGVSRCYGPTGANCDYTDASLADTDPDNPVNAAGIPRKWGQLDVPDVTTPAGALTIGQAWLAERKLPQRRGTIVVPGYARHPTAGLRPSWEIRAGDFVRVEDHPADVPRKIIETRYDRQARANTLTVGNTSHKLDALMEFMGASLVGKV